MMGDYLITYDYPNVTKASPFGAGLVFKFLDFVKMARGMPHVDGGYGLTLINGNQWLGWVSAIYSLHEYLHATQG